MSYLYVPLTSARIPGEANTHHLLGVSILLVIVHLHGGFCQLPCHYCFSGRGTARSQPLTTHSVCIWRLLIVNISLGLIENWELVR
jgi:hypothetical protein